MKGGAKQDTGPSRSAVEGGRGQGSRQTAPGGARKESLSLSFLSTGLGPGKLCFVAAQRGSDTSSENHICSLENAGQRAAPALRLWKRLTNPPWSHVWPSQGSPCTFPLLLLCVWTCRQQAAPRHLLLAQEELPQPVPGPWASVQHRHTRDD